jgi:hypothetical protein
MTDGFPNSFIGIETQIILRSKVYTCEAATVLIYDRDA